MRKIVNALFLSASVTNALTCTNWLEREGKTGSYDHSEGFCGQKPTEGGTVTPLTGTGVTWAKTYEQCDEACAAKGMSDCVAFARIENLHDTKFVCYLYDHKQAGTVVYGDNTKGYDAKCYVKTQESEKCYPCPDGQRRDPSEPTECIANNCPAGSIYKDLNDKSDNPECTKCGSNTKPSLDGTSCEAEKCDEKTEYLHTDGTCKKCASGTTPAADGKSCCSNCATLYRPNVLYSPCNNYYWHTNTCTTKVCPEGQVTYDGLHCVNKPCAWNEKRDDHGKCHKCGDNEIVSADGKDCIPCPTTEVTPQCTAPLVLDPEDGKTCIKICTEREIREDATTCKKCDDYTKPNADKTKCETCEYGFVASLLGECSRCPAGYYVSNDQKMCMKDLKCDPYTYKSADGTACLTCPVHQYAKADGSCHDCAAGSQTLDQRTCTPIACKATEVKKDGKCVCPEYTTRQRSGECRADLCHYREILLPSGGCQACALYTMPDAARRTCYTPTCPAQSICRADATCSPCGWGTQPDAAQRTCVAAAPTAYPAYQPAYQAMPVHVAPQVYPTRSTCAWGSCGFGDEVFLGAAGASAYYYPNYGYHGRWLSALESASEFLGIN